MQAGFRPAELKFKAHMSQWCKVEAVVSVDVECVLPSSTPCGNEEEGTRRGRGKEEPRMKLDQAQARVCAGYSVMDDPQ